jgi:hypothetical protein
MKTILSFEKMKDKSGKVKQIMSVTLRTDIPTGKKLIGTEDDKEVVHDEKLVINAIAEVPEDSPLGKELQSIIVDLLKQQKKKADKEQAILIEKEINEKNNL